MVAAPILDAHHGTQDERVREVSASTGLQSAHHRPRTTTPATPTPSTKPTPTTSPSAPSSAPTPQGGVSTTGPVSREVVARIGLVSMNEFHDLPVAEARSDAVAVTSRKDVDVVGWQEADPYHGMLRSLSARGWATKTYPGGSRELAVSWRRSLFTLASAQAYFVAPGKDAEQVRYPYEGRYVLRVTLRQRTTGDLFTVLDTHLPSKIEDLADPGHFRTDSNATAAREQIRRIASLWDTVPGRWVVGTGDYNFDDFSDRRVEPADGIARSFRHRAVSSWQVLGRRGTAATHPNSGRRIDYVFISQATYAADRARFLSQTTLHGLHSDHRPLVTRIALR